MVKRIYIFAIESSCDDTACAIMDDCGHIVSQAVLSQIAHASLGGVVPEIAARAHLKNLPNLVHLTLNKANLTLKDIDFFAATTGPGLIGGVIVGSNYAKGLALALNKPFLSINHIESHILVSRLASNGKDIKFPYLAILMSGGHCQCIFVKDIGHYQCLGRTIDDSAGEAFDKVAKMLGLGWPGGPALEKLAKDGYPFAYKLPRPLLGRKGCDFSFSGLKTAVMRYLDKYDDGSLPYQVAVDLAASFQRAVVDIMIDRVTHALESAPHATHLVLAGGVAANQEVRQAFEKFSQAHNIPFTAPPPNLCTDNAVMIAWTALERLRKGDKRNEIDSPPRPRWPLEEIKFVAS